MAQAASFCVPKSPCKNICINLSFCVTESTDEVMNEAVKVMTDLVQKVDDHGYQVGGDDGLHLLLVACCDVGQEPHCLLQDGRTAVLSLTTPSSVV